MFNKTAENESKKNPHLAHEGGLGKILTTGFNQRIRKAVLKCALVYRCGIT